MERYIINVSDKERPGLEYLRRGDKILVKSVRAGSPAAEAGVPIGGHIKFINGQKVNSVKSLQKALRSTYDSITVDIIAKSDSDGEKVFEASTVTPNGELPCIVRITDGVMATSCDGRISYVDLSTIKSVTLLEVPHLIMCFDIEDGEVDQLLLSRVNTQEVMKHINKCLVSQGLPPITVDEPVDDSDDESNASSASSPPPRDSPQTSISRNHSERSSVRYDHRVKFACTTPVCANPKLASLSVVPTASLSDQFAPIKSILARRGGATVYYLATCKEGIVAIGKDAVYRWVSSKESATTAKLERCVPITEISELVISQSDRSYVGLKVPSQHDELLSLPPSSIQCWETVLCALHYQSCKRILPVRRVQSMTRPEFSQKLWLHPQSGFDPSSTDVIPLSYEYDRAESPTGQLKPIKLVTGDFLTDYLDDEDATAAAEEKYRHLDILLPKSKDRDKKSKSRTHRWVEPDQEQPSRQPSPQQAGNLNDTLVNAKETEIASLRSMLVTKQREMAHNDATLATQLRSGVPVTAPMGIGGRTPASVSPAAISNITEREFLREQVDILSQQLRSMVEELAVLKEAPLPPPITPLSTSAVSPYPIASMNPNPHSLIPLNSPPPPLATVRKDLSPPAVSSQLADRLEVLESVVLNKALSEKSQEPQQRPVPPNTAHLDLQLNQLALQAKAAAAMAEAPRVTGLRPRN
eukprot:TRINITY_DN3477_c0_g1_i1.p1 TRINITY_DN3477_c0_g1~~TRINITY_DN3477_c0_g1_i1.p1  ORF type:complete len:698 (+),score=147.24 TRINITY_DN3477_c0_g1_i1:98-2191(+)